MAGDICSALPGVVCIDVERTVPRNTDTPRTTLGVWVDGVLFLDDGGLWCVVVRGGKTSREAIV